MKHHKTLTLSTIAAFIVLAGAGAGLPLIGARPAPTEIVQLERVVIEGRRAAEATPAAAAVAQLPRVVITGRSSSAPAEGGGMRLAAANLVGAIKARAL